MPTIGYELIHAFMYVKFVDNYLCMYQYVKHVFGCFLPRIRDNPSSRTLIHTGTCVKP